MTTQQRATLCRRRRPAASRVCLYSRWPSSWPLRWGAWPCGSGLTSRRRAVTLPSSCGPGTPKLTVQGTGQATAKPDLLTVVVQVNTTGPSATSALASDNADADAVVAAFRSGGVESRDIQTANLSLQPQYAYPKGVPTLTGYQVANSSSPHCGTSRRRVPPSTEWWGWRETRSRSNRSGSPHPTRMSWRTRRGRGPPRRLWRMHGCWPGRPGDPSVRCAP